MGSMKVFDPFPARAAQLQECFCRQTWNLENLEIAHDQSWNSKFDRAILRFFSELAQDYSMVFNIL